MAGKSYQSYSPAKVAEIVGVAPVVGKGKDEFISVAYTSDQVQVEVGVDGEGQFSDILDASGEITMTLMAYSATNAVMTALAKARATFPFTVKDNSSVLSLFSTKQCKVKKRPDWKRAKVTGEVQWVMSFISGEILHGEAKEISLI